MAWQEPIESVRATHLRAYQAELARDWHLAVQHYLYCYEQACGAGDGQAARFFAAKLSKAYAAMGLVSKAGRFAAGTD